MTWQPSDDELGAVARSLPAPSRDAARIEQERTSVLAQAAAVAQHKRASRAPLVVAVATAFAAAAAVLIWFVARPSEPAAPKELVTAIGPARFERSSAWPEYRVSLHDGRLAIVVAALAAGERFRATTSDADIEVRGAKFFVGAEHDHVTFVSVGEGRAEVRWAHQPPIILAAGQTWVPPRIVERDTIELTPPPSEPVVTRAPAPPKKKHAIEKTTAPAPPPNEAIAKPPEPTAPRPGEADFRAGIASLRAGDAATATKSFASACAAARGDALAEDACFWLGAAAKRAGQVATARDALTRFLATFPSSARAGEAAALLGWILYDAGELDAAKQRFDVAARDRVPKVKESALKGLEAIKRKSASP